jgi:hypothetical protein
MSDASVLPDVTGQHLLAPLRQALGDERAELRPWTIQALTGGRGLVGGVYRIAGDAWVGQEVVPWSLILKIVLDPHTEDDERAVNYWKREFLAYQAQLLTHLPGGVAAPRCFAAIEYVGHATWLWLEDVQRPSDSSWRVADYARTARHLGQFNGAYLVERPVTIHPWLNHQLLRKWLALFESYVEQLSGTLAQPIVQRFCPPSAADRLLRLWGDRSRLLDALEHLPQTFCHHDAFRRNLLASVDDRTVAVDWEFAGIGAVGEELGPLVGGSLAMMAAEAGMAHDLDEAAFAGYLAGLRDTHWPGSPDLVRFACATSVALRFGLVWGLWLAVQLGGGENGHAAVESFYNQPVDAVADHFATVLPWLLDRGDEARRLLWTLSSNQDTARGP